MKKINYVIASWSGNRPCMTLENPLEKHLSHLNKLKHNIDQITIGYPYNPKENIQYTNFIKKQKSLKNTPISIIPMINNGASYGQYSRIFDKYQDQFQYWIFIEDDYVPYIDHFDSILIDLFDKHKKLNNCGFLCHLVTKIARHPYHAAISNGISDNDSLMKIIKKFGKIPYHAYKYDESQVNFSRSFITAGMSLSDMRPMYKAPYWNCTSLKEFYPQGLNYLIVPIQMIHNQKSIKIL